MPRRNLSRFLLRPANTPYNHLNQNRAFEGRIPKNDGIVIPMNGATNIPGSEHHLFHQSLEEFWRPFRDPGVAPPTNAQYDSALRAAMNHAGMSAENVEFFATQARRQRLLYGLNDGAPVPNVPGPIPGY